MDLAPDHNSILSTSSVFQSVDTNQVTVLQFYSNRLQNVHKILCLSFAISSATKEDLSTKAEKLDSENMTFILFLSQITVHQCTFQ